MKFSTFQEKAQPVKDVPDPALLYCSNALGGEAGEFQNIVKKVYRDGMTSAKQDALLDEGGDVLFYLKVALEAAGFTLEDAAKAALAKLDRKRKEQGECKP